MVAVSLVTIGTAMSTVNVSYAERKIGIDGSQFLVSNIKGLAIEVEMGLSKDGVDTLHTLNTDWTK